MDFTEPSPYTTPTLLIIFNRPEKTGRVFEAIRKIRPTKLYIAADGPRNNHSTDLEKCQESRKIIEQVDWSCEIKRNFSDKNMGADKRVETALDWFFTHESEGIILEDDCIPHEDFFTFTKTLLERYRNDHKIMMISGNNFQDGIARGDRSYYFSQYPNTWGWATWRRAWQKYDSTLSALSEFIKKDMISKIRPVVKEQKYWLKFFNDLKRERYGFWDAKWLFTIWNCNGLSITPNVNLVQNIGFGQDATHTKDKINSVVASNLQSLIITDPPEKISDEKADQYLFKKIYKNTFVKSLKNWSGYKKKFLEENFFRPRWYSVFLNPYFINRSALYSAIKKFASTVPATAKILDVGCGTKPYKILFKSEEYIGIDIAGGGHADTDKRVDKYYDSRQIPFSDESFDALICTQVLEHADDPEVLIKECSRVLKNKGTIFLSMPFIYPEHEKPYDFRRFTRFEHTRLLKKNGFENIAITKTTGFFGTFGQLFVVMVFESMHFRASILKTILSIVVFAPIQIISLLLDFITRKIGPTMDYVIIAQKR